MAHRHLEHEPVNLLGSSLQFPCATEGSSAVLRQISARCARQVSSCACGSVLTDLSLEKALLAKALARAAFISGSRTLVHEKIPASVTTRMEKPFSFTGDLCNNATTAGVRGASGGRERQNQAATVGQPLEPEGMRMGDAGIDEYRVTLAGIEGRAVAHVDRDVCVNSEILSSPSRPSLDPPRWRPLSHPGQRLRP